MTTESKGRLAGALAKAQGAVFRATRDGKNPFFNSTYATLAEVLGTVREPLAENGFALVQDADTDLDERTVGVVTRLIHESGEELVSCRLSAPLKDEFTKDGKPLPPSVQQIGSMVTYLRRYSLCSFLSVAVEDDDGNGVTAIGKGTPDVARSATPPQTGVRRSAYTGEVLPRAAKVKPKQDPEPKPEPKPAQKPEPKPEPKEKPAPVVQSEPKPPVEDPKLLAAMKQDGISVEELEGYLRGVVGNPRISKSILLGDMTLASLGERIVASMLQPKNWGMIVERIHAVDDIPF